MRTCKLSLSDFFDVYPRNNRILVLKDGQIVEQGTHKELVELNGAFAAMWADQITATGEQTVDEGREVLDGYQIDDVVIAEPAIVDIDAAPTQDTPDVEETLPSQESEDTRVQVVLDVPVDETPIAFPSTNEAAVIDAVPVTFPTTDFAPITFPGTSSDNEAASQKAPSTAQTPGITFAPEVGTPERTGTPDPDAEPKRKRISSQNFQRLARRISVSTRRAGSISGIPILGNLRRDTSSASAPQAQASTDGGDAGPVVASESPAASIQSEPDKDKSKKEKKDKKRRTFL
jgi:hypothetical protein